MAKTITYSFLEIATPYIIPMIACVPGLSKEIVDCPVDVIERMAVQLRTFAKSKLLLNLIDQFLNVFKFTNFIF